MTVIVDYGMGNLRSAQKGLAKAGVDAVISDDPSDIDRADTVVLPGVGAFGDCLEKVPFHVYIKWRVNNPAGFEGGTSIFINPLRPTEVRDRMVPDLFRLRAEGKISQNIRIAEECPVEPNTLRYNAL